MKALLILLLITQAGYSQNVPDAKKAALRHQRFTEAFNEQYVKDSIWFYSQIEESYSVNKNDTAFWILKTPKRLLEHSFEQIFETSTSTVTDSTYSEITSGIEYVGTAVTVGKVGESHSIPAGDTTRLWFGQSSGIITGIGGGDDFVFEPHKKKRKKRKKKARVTYSKVYGKAARYHPYANLVGYFPYTSDITPDAMMQELPENVNASKVGYLVIRCDDRELLRILRNAKL